MILIAMLTLIMMMMLLPIPAVLEVTRLVVVVVVVVAVARRSFFARPALSATAGSRSPRNEATSSASAAHVWFVHCAYRVASPRSQTGE